jgi:hypothetical protein
VAWFLQVAIEQALLILNWHENLPPEEIPPQYLWEDPEGQEQWRQQLQTRKEYAASTGRSLSDVGDEELVSNDLAREFRG